MALLNVHDYEAAAAACLDPAVHGYFAGGAGDEATLRDNVAAFGRWALRPRVLVDVAECTTATTVLGQGIALPLIVAPVAYQRVAHPEGEVGMANAARAAGTIMCLSALATSTPADIAATGALRWFQLYVFEDEGLTRDLVDQARAGGFGALVLTVDTPVLGRRERDDRNAFVIPDDIAVAALGRGGITPHGAADLMTASLTWDDVDRLVSDAGLPVILKGIATAEDAHLACEHGVAGLVVSNHGGRQLDGALASLDALPEVVEAVDGRLEILVDGGIRRGADVVKALALGAKAVLAGRAPLWGLAVAGEEGVRHVLELLGEEIRVALQLSGCGSPAAISRAHVTRRPAC